MRNHGVKRGLLWVAVAVMTTMIFTGCENLLGDDDESNPDGETNPVEVAEDGTLTLSVSGVPMELESTTETEGDEDLLFAAFVFNSGGNPLDEADAEENWVAMVAEEIVDGSASGTAFQMVDGARGDEWVGTAGETYDVYYTIYCVTMDAEGPPQKAGAHFIESNPECVHGTVDWQSPVSYGQDGDVSLSSSYGDYLETSRVEFVAGGALGLVGLVMNSMPEGGPPEELGEVTLDPPITGITVEMTANDSTESTFDVELVITIEDYEYPETGLDPAPTANGTIALSVVGTGEEDMQLGFVTSDLVLSLGGDSVSVEMDGTASDFAGDEGPSTVTGVLACDEAEHDIAILMEMYEVTFLDSSSEPVKEIQ